MENDKDETGVQILPEMTVRKETDLLSLLGLVIHVHLPTQGPLHPANTLPTAINGTELYPINTRHRSL